MMRVAVLGASGFVGATLVERLWQTGEAEVVPIIHSSGNAARLARFGRPLVMADVLQPATLDRALDGCTHVVNCSRGPAEVMVEGLRNIIEASRRARVQRFVHLSSVAVYGDIDRTGPLVEGETPRPTPHTYGWTKLLQDKVVERAAARGLSCTVLCPPNISGSYSHFLLDMLQSLRRRELALVEAGGLPCELIDVENLVHAIALALRAADTGPNRIFVTDGASTTWADLVAALAPLADCTLPVPSMSLADARRMRGENGTQPSMFAAAKHFLSADVRSVLRKDPWLARAEKNVKGYVRRVPQLNQALARRFHKRPAVKTNRSAQRVSERQVLQQLRNIRYSQARARQVIGYQPVVSPEASMDAFRSWYAQMFGWNESSWRLTCHLYE
jgi:nucleoside-diphosphate-sugar epimerase